MLRLIGAKRAEGGSNPACGSASAAQTFAPSIVGARLEGGGSYWLNLTQTGWSQSFVWLVMIVGEDDAQEVGRAGGISASDFQEPWSASGRICALLRALPLDAWVRGAWERDRVFGSSTP